VNYATLPIVPIAAIVMPPLFVALARGWASLATVFIGAAGLLGFLSYEVVQGLSLDGPGSPGQVFGLLIADVGVIVMTAAWFAFLLAAALKAYRIATKSPKSSARKV
jgi:hypothetical protein